MKAHLRHINFIFITCILLTTGCDQSPQTGKKANQNSAKPFAVLAIAPANQWYTEAIAMSENREPETVCDKTLRRILPGIDVKRPAAAFLYLSEKKIPEPILYLPVRNYKLFEYDLNQRFGLKKAASSSFSIGPYKIYVKQKDEFAILGTSIKGINHAPEFPTDHIEEMPEGFDFAFKLHTESLRKSEKNKIAKAIDKSMGQSLGEQLANLVKENDSFVFGMNMDSTDKLGFVTSISPLPVNAAEIEDFLSKLFESHGLIASSEIKEDCLLCNIELPSAQLDKTWAEVRPVLTDAFKTHLDVLAMRATGNNPNKFNMKITYQKGYGSGFTSGSSGGGGGGRRS